jgi:hypothetical protein
MAASVGSAIYGRQQADIANRALLASQRPWIPGKFWVSSDLTFDEKQGWVTIRYKLQNVGNTVATSVEVKPKFFPFRVGKIEEDPPVLTPFPLPLMELRTLCGQMAETNDSQLKLIGSTERVFSPMSRLKTASTSI